MHKVKLSQFTFTGSLMHQNMNDSFEKKIILGVFLKISLHVLGNFIRKYDLNDY